MAQETPDKESRRYSLVGKYRVVAHIATGGMGAVYKALDPDTGREVAIKILPPELAARPDLLERFRREARNCARLRHDNIVSLVEFGEAGGTHFLVMEFIEGIDLFHHIERCRLLDAAVAVDIFIQVVHALDHAYQQGIVHRDIKPSNVLLTEVDGRLVAKLTDLGLSREANDEEFKVTRDGSTVGTVDYMSPEQARDSRAADIRSDLYSLGCTLFHMLTGAPPFGQGSLTERIFAHAEAEPPDPRQYNPGVPEWLVEVLRRLMAKKPAQRYQTPAELLEELESHAAFVPEPRSAADPDGDTHDPAILSQETSVSLPVVEGGPGPESRRADEPEAPPPPRVSPVPRAAASPVPRPPKPAAAPPPARPPVVVDKPVLPPPSSEHLRIAAGQFVRANEVVASENYEYGIPLLLTCCRLDPSNLAYRQALRQAQRALARRHGRARWLTWLKTLRPRLKMRAAVRAGDHLKVLDHGEQVLTQDPEDRGAQLAMAEAAQGLGLFTVAVWVLDQARAKDTRDHRIHRALARVLEKQGDYAQAISILEDVVKALPHDGDARQKLKDLSARDTIARARYAGSREGRRSSSKRSGRNREAPTSE
jgi:serine/threonine protein kinase